MAVGTQIYKNEISNISSHKTASGISFIQSIVGESISNNIKFPDRNEEIKIYSNII